MDHGALKLTLRVVCKRFSIENRAVLHWEGTCEWSTQSETTTTTLESGWVIVRPFAPSSLVSAVQSFVHIRQNDSAAAPWLLQFIRKRSALAKVILPSSGQAMAQQHQSVENWLIDSKVQFQIFS